MKKTNLIEGKTDSGKTKGILFKEVEKIINNKENILILDSKKEYYKRFGKTLQENNYNIIVVNLNEPKHSNTYNPYTLPLYYYKQNDVDKAVELLEKIGKEIFTTEINNDPFWSNSATDLFIGLSLLLFKEAPEDKINIGTLSICANEVVSSDQIKNYLQNLKASDPIYMSLATTIFAPNDTKGSILSVFRQKINKYCLRENLMNLLGATNFDLINLKDKTSIFIIGYKNEIANMLIEQIYNLVLFKDLKINLILDNIETIPPIKSLKDMIDLSSDNMPIYIATRDRKITEEVYNNHNLFSNIKNIITVKDEINIDKTTPDEISFPINNNKAQYFNIKEKL